MVRFEVPEGWCVQAFRFTLDPTEEQARSLARYFVALRKAFNWTVAALKADIEAWHASGFETEKPSLRVLRKRWNTSKDEVCVNADTGQSWWRECSKEAYADGVGGAVDAYWNWQTSRSGKRGGKRVGFPRFKKKGRDSDRVCFTTGAMRVEPDRRHLTLPVIGTVRTYENTRDRVGFPRFKKKGRDSDRVCFTTGAMRVEPDRRHLTLPVIGTVRTYENTRRIERLITKGQARVLAISVRRNGTRLDASVRVLVQRPQQPRAALPDSRVGVDVGVRRLATVANDG